MAWKYIGDGSFFPGVPHDAGELISDEAFAEYARRFDEREGTEGGLAASGLYERVDDAKPAKKSKEA